MAGDISRDTFDPAKHFSRVLMQQGRVLLDADWNEQTAIHLHYLRTLAADLIGPAAGPRDDCGFRIEAPNRFVGDDETDTRDGEFPRRTRGEEILKDEDGGGPRPRPRPPVEAPRNFLIGAGRYYVEGILCENDFPVFYTRPEKGHAPVQPDWPADELENGLTYLVYLVAWERDVNALEDESIREVALGAHGPDTATRAKVVWQVKAEEWDASLDGISAIELPRREQWRKQLEKWRPANRGRLKAKADEADDPNAATPCIISPDARYRGAENQLYRVEIHRGGMVADGATFKWSRENASVNLPVRTVSGNQVTLEYLGRDARLGLQIGDLVELADEDYSSGNRAEPLLRITDIDPAEMIVTLSDTPASVFTGTDERPIILRRWDGAGSIKEVAGGSANWVELEDGVKIQFQPGGSYRTGDFWRIPARTATGDVEWPGPVGQPEARPPHGIEHHYAPLARIRVEDAEVTVETDLRLIFAPLAVEPAVEPR
ncbi:MAG: DUF6519 domain-containing protein [Acidobacteria bacterium]|nr:DUF6519 domain-containing protein [Acidobacteriota bacterium]